MARCGAPERSPSPAIARRSCGCQQLRSVEDGGVVLARGKITERVKTKGDEEIRRKGRERGVGVVGIDGGLGFLPTASGGR